MIDCIREEYIGEGDRQRYLEQIAANQIYIRRYVTPSATFQILHLWASQMAFRQPGQHECLGDSCCK